MFFFLIKDKISKSKSTSLTFVIKGVPGRFSLSGGGGGGGGCYGGVRGVLRVFRECSGPVPAFTDTPRFTLSRAQSLLSRAVSRVWPVNNEFKSD